MVKSSCEYLVPEKFSKLDTPLNKDVYYADKAASL